MAMTGSRETVVQNLEDAGCDSKIIKDFLEWFDKGKKEKQLEVLENQRKKLLDRIHKEEWRISCLDYLTYQIQRTESGKRSV